MCEVMKHEGELPLNATVMRMKSSVGIDSGQSRTTMREALRAQALRREVCEPTRFPPAIGMSP